jgi:hypothetical protein
MRPPFSPIASDRVCASAVARGEHFVLFGFHRPACEKRVEQDAADQRERQQRRGEVRQQL